MELKAQDLEGVRSRTILFTDIAQSTGLHGSYGPQKAEALRRRVEFLTTHALAHWEPEFVKSTGDGVMAVFENASGAIRGAAAIQHAVSDLNKRDDLPPAKLRIGISAGDVKVTADGDTYGAAVAEASRLEGNAPVNGILAAQVVIHLDRGYSGASFGDLSDYSLKGIHGGVRASVVDWQSMDLNRTPAVPLPSQLEDTLRSPFPFAEREVILARIRDQVHGSEDDRRRVMFVSGQSGIGKTRFLAELADNIRSSGDLILVGHCIERTTAPMFCFREVLESFCKLAGNDKNLAATLTQYGDSLSKVAEGVADIAPTATPLSHDPQPSNQELELQSIYDSLASWLRELAKRQDFVLLLEDLQYATPETIGFVEHYLRERVDGLPCLIIALNRELCSNELKRLMTEAIQRDRASEYKIEPLTINGVEELLMALPERRLSILNPPGELGLEGKELAATLHELSGGLPSLINLLVREAHDQEVSRMDDQGVWRVIGDLGELANLDSFQSVVASRLSRCTPEARVAASELAVLGTPATLVQFLAMTKIATGSPEDAIQSLRDARLVAASDGTIRFETEAVERAIYQDLGASRRAALHLAAADAVERQAEQDRFRVPFGQIAEHLGAAVHLTGSGAGRAAGYYFAAGVSALKREIATDARAAFATVESLVHRHPLADESLIRACLAFAKAMALEQGHSPDARRSFHSARELAHSLGHPELDGMSGAELDEYFEPLRRSIAESDSKNGTAPEVDSLSVFVSYSHKDAAWLDRVNTHLRPLARDESLDLWHDRRLRAGDEWHREIDDALGRADVAVLLCSADFLASDFIASDELPPVLAAAHERGLRIVAVHVGASLFTERPELARFQSINDPSEPLDAIPRAKADAVLRDLASFVSSLSSS